MNRVRLEQIKQEMQANPAAFQKDGHLYFQEFLPVLEKILVEIKVAPKVEVKKPEPVKVEVKEVEPKKIVFSGKLKKKKPRFIK